VSPEPRVRRKSRERFRRTGRKEVDDTGTATEAYDCSRTFITHPQLEVHMKYSWLLVVVFVGLAMLGGQALAQDTLVVYASTDLLDVVITGTHKVYKLVSRDTTYLYENAVTVSSDITVLGVLDPVTGRPPCIQPAVLPDNSTPPNLFVLNGIGQKATFKNLYLLGTAINNTVNNGNVAIQVSADNITVHVDNVVFEEWLTFAIGYNGNWDKFIITNSKFRNMVEPNQWYIGEALRNEWPGAAYTDSVIFRGNTFFCVNGYASATVTKYWTRYFEFSHNNVVYTFKNPFFEFNTTIGKFNNNLFYGPWAGGIAKAEYPWWDQLWSPEVGSIIDMDTLDLAKDSLFNPSDIGQADFRKRSEQKRVLDVKNNVYWWPTAMTDFWHAWNDTATVDSIYTATWMNARTTNMFTDKTWWPGFNQSGNQNVDPGFGASIPAVMTQSTNGLFDWFRLIRSGQTPINTWGYSRTTIPQPAPMDWKPAWPLPEAADMAYSNTALKTGATDGGPIGDPNWFGIAVGVQDETPALPAEFALSQNYPNPFNPATVIPYTLAKSSTVTLTVFNILGQEVATLVNEFQVAGTHQAVFSAQSLASGMYFYKLEAGDFSAVRKMLLLK
jgi:hypothetical protein